MRRHPAGSYFILTFAISWGSFFLVGGRGFFAGTSWQDDPLSVLAVTALLIGPPVAGVALTGLVKGRPGFRELAVRLLKWRVGIRWYAVALLTAPLAMTVVLLPLSVLIPPVPPRAGHHRRVCSAVARDCLGLAGGFLEELGWTGFVIPSLRSTRSLLVAILMHTSLIASSISGFGLVPPSISGVPFLIMFLAFTGLLWLIVAAVTVVHRGQLTQHPDPEVVDVQPAAHGPSSGGT